MITSAAEYHRVTSYSRRALSGHYLDWANQPSVFKAYSGLERLKLPEVGNWRERDYLEIVAADTTNRQQPITFQSLSRILTLTHCLTAKTRHDGNDFYYRNVASAGALYPFELYLAANELKQFETGLYHHSPADQTLCKVRSSGIDIRSLIPQSKSNSQIVVFITAIFFRSSWKYRDRAYRYHLLDSGHLLENLTTALKYENVHFSVFLDFDDEATNSYLGVNSDKEACIAICTAGESISSRVNIKENFSPIPELMAASQTARIETDYPMILEIHKLSQTVEPEHQKETGCFQFSGRQSNYHLPRLQNYPESLFARRSRRNFSEQQTNGSLLSYLLETLLASDYYMDHPAETTLSIRYLFSGSQDIPAGYYSLNFDSRDYTMITKGDYLKQSARTCLDQLWLAHAAMHYMFLFNISDLEAKFGPRGYRYAMINAGRLGQRIYMASTSLYWGCCGIGAFYDDEVQQLVNWQDHSMGYLVGSGPITGNY